MMAVIKAAAAAKTVRMFAAPAPARSPAEPSAEAMALTAARDQIARLERAATAAEGAARQSERQALERGCAEGAKDAARAADARVEAMRTALAAARTAWDVRLASVDALAVELAQAALAKVFAPSADLADLTVRAIRRQLADAAAGSVVALVVSEADFPGGEGLDGVAEPVRAAGATIAASPTLRSGECRLELRLGERAIGAVDQWRTLAAFLAELAPEPVS